MSLDDAHPRRDSDPGQLRTSARARHRSAPATPSSCARASPRRDGRHRATGPAPPPAVAALPASACRPGRRCWRRHRSSVEGSPCRGGGEGLIERMFEDPAIAYLHARRAKWGCYARRGSIGPEGWSRRPCSGGPRSTTPRRQ
ncbi:hypothetical protein ACRAWD_24845 [Caulobacter segnis]